MLRLLPALAALGLIFAACGSNPEANSGGDAYRNAAEPMPLDEWVAGDLDADNGDTTDWKSVDIAGAGRINVEFNADDKDAVVVVSVYDRYGYKIGAVKRPSGASGPVATVAKAKGSGKHFVRIQQRSGSPTAYSVRVTTGSSSGTPTPDF
ncbi:MAG: hypothetical protein CSA66_05495 [Proteobacteria bacterium]|nr:MAG: hypothetical protein CSA66_05495 [Pseudomonadota bacterium]